MNRGEQEAKGMIRIGRRADSGDGGNPRQSLELTQCLTNPAQELLRLDRPGIGVEVQAEALQRLTQGDRTLALRPTRVQQ